MCKFETSEQACLVWVNGECWLLTAVEGREQCSYLGEIGSVGAVRTFCESHEIEFVIIRGERTESGPLAASHNLVNG